MVAIRIEHEDGFGMFWEDVYDDEGNSIDRNNTVWNIEGLHNVGSRHADFNTPYEDGFKHEMDGFYCAYKSVEQLYNWVTQEEIEILVDNGYSIYSLSLKDGFIGNHQMVFRKEDVIGRKNITNLFVK